MRIVDTCNFGNDYPNEKFILCPMTEELAQRVCDTLNAYNGPESPRFYKVVKDDYVLVPGFEP